MSKTVRFLTSFIQHVKEVQRGDQKHVFFYRGQADANWRCIPSLGRMPYQKEDIFDGTPRGRTRSVEWALYSRFRDLSAPYESGSVFGADDPPEAGWRRLILARHAGVPTRLLDWSMKPLVALFFAVHGDNRQCEKIPCKLCGEKKKCRDHDACVFMQKYPDENLFGVIGLARAHKKPPRYQRKPNLRDPGFFIPPDVHQRVSVQGSVFSIGSNPRKPVATEPWVIIPAENRKTMLRDLEDLGINYATLFPDLDGIGKRLREEGELWALKRAR